MLKEYSLNLKVLKLIIVEFINREDREVAAENSLHSEPSCSKLMTSLVNSLKFQMLISERRH